MLIYCIQKLFDQDPVHAGRAADKMFSFFLPVVVPGLVISQWIDIVHKVGLLLWHLDHLAHASLHVACNFFARVLLHHFAQILLLLHDFLIKKLKNEKIMIFQISSKNIWLKDQEKGPQTLFEQADRRQTNVNKSFPLGKIYPTKRQCKK